MSSKTAVVLQQKMMASWAGRPVDSLGLLRVLNEGGSRPPLLWIFNETAEPLLLADAMGEDQPLFFSRSTHLLIRPEDDPADTRNPLAQYLAQEIKRHVHDVCFDIGSSCQGTSLALLISTILLEEGIDVGCFCMINCALPKVATHRPALLIYGDEDPQHDPFTADDHKANQSAQSLFSRYTRVVLHARHGGYYSPEVLGEIVPRLDAFRRRFGAERSVPPQALRPSGNRLSWTGALRIPTVLRALRKRPR